MVPTSMEGLTSQKCAEIFMREVYPQWGTPRAIRSDRDVRFVSSFWKEFCNGIGTTLAMTTSGRASSNGKIERMHRDANAMMRQHVSEEQTNWASQVKQVQFAINTTVHSSTGYAPFALSRIQAPVGIPSWARAPGSKAADELIQDAKQRLDKARDTLHKAQAYQTHSANKHRRPDHVPFGKNIVNGAYESAYWVSTADLGTVANRSRKWCPPFTGPFICLEYDPKTSLYLLDLPPRYTQRGISPLFHASKLKPYVMSAESLFPGRLTNPVPVFPLDTLEMDINYISTHKILAVPTPEDGLATALQFKVVPKDGSKPVWFTMPHDDFTPESPHVIAYLAKRGVATMTDLQPVSTAQFSPELQASQLTSAAIRSTSPFPGRSPRSAISVSIPTSAWSRKTRSDSSVAPKSTLLATTPKSRASPRRLVVSKPSTNAALVTTPTTRSSSRSTSRTSTQASSTRTTTGTWPATGTNTTPLPTDRPPRWPGTISSSSKTSSSSSKSSSSPVSRTSSPLPRTEEASLRLPPRTPRARGLRSPSSTRTSEGCNTCEHCNISHMV
jgi:hypothetical protein